MKSKSKSTLKVHLAFASALFAFALPGVAFAQSTNADLSDLVPSAGILDPVFDSATISYTADVTTSSITVTPTAADALATITVNGSPVVSGDASSPISLDFGSNVISTVVTAEDAVTTKTYTLTVTRTVPSTITAAPVAYWPMRDGLPGATVPTGTGNAAVNVIDIANTFVNGTVNNTNSTWQADPTRGIVWSTTEGNRINAGTQGINLNDGFTWSLWVNAATSNITDPGADCIIGTRSGWNKIDLTSTSNWNGALPPSGSYANLARSEWIHIAYVGHSSFGRRLYVDGELVASNATTTSATFSGPLEIGGTSQFSEDITGLYSDVAIWNQALTFEQITDLANGANVITDVTAPVIAATTPADDDLNASSALLQAIFDEPVFVGTGEIRIVNDTDTVTTTIDVTDAAQVTVSGSSITLNPSTPLIVGKSYHIEMDAGVVKNAENLNFGGIADSTTWNFTVDNTPPTLVSMVDSVGGGPIYEDQAFFFYDITFNEPIDGDTVTAADFDNAGTATISIGTVTQNSPTEFTVQVLPTTTGTLQLRIPAGSIVNDPSGNSLSVPVLDDTTIDILSGSNPGTGNRYWDGAITSGVTDGVSQGGTGTWSTSNTNWDRGLGFEGPVAWNNTNNDIAILGGANGVATLTEPITVGGLRIDNRNIDITGSTLTFGVAGEINSTSVGNQNDPPIINSIITGAAVTKTGAGYLDLKGNNSMAAFTLEAGTLGQLPGGTFTGIGTGLFTINGGGFFVTNNDQTTINNDMVWNGNWFTQNVSNGGKINEWNGNVSLGASITISSKHAQVFNGIISDGGNNHKLTLTNSGGGSTITLSNANTFGGGVQVNQGTLNINNASAIGSGTFTISGATTLNNTSGNPVTLSTNNVQAWNNNITFTGSNDLNLGTGAVTMNNNRTVTVNAGTLTVGGAIGQSGGNRTLSKAGNGTLVLSGANSYAGNTTVSAGTLALVGGSQNSAITVNSGASLGFTLGSPTTSSKALTLSGGHAIAITGTVDNTSDYQLMTASAITGTPALSAPIADYELELREGDTELWLVFTGTAGTPYDSWADGTFANGTLTDKTPTGDDDADGLSNLLEFAFGTDPTVSDAGALVAGAPVTPGSPVVSLDYPVGGGVDFTALFMRRQDHGTSGSAAYAWQFSSDLADWESSADAPAPGWLQAPTDIGDDASGDYDLMEVAYPLFLDNGKKARFFRVEVSIVP